ncbi:hypothetical protein AB834_00285 [PVC group bacterium (ex Bugula neritina AB1)]|nr:hypothetical protein AB834_00285 [PVC group bacterium (ex Bugula neritina AB1)]
MYHRGGGIRRKVYFIDFFRNSSEKVFIVCGFIWRVNKSNLAILKQSSQVGYTSIIACQDLRLGSRVFNHNYINKNNSSPIFNVGSNTKLGDMPVGSLVNCIEVNPNRGGVLIRSRGCFGIIIDITKQTTLVKMPSGQVLSVSSNCRATFGKVTIQARVFEQRKAGHARWLGYRPTVRGVAINAVDHPHGGGEGKGRVGRNPVSPWGFKVFNLY